LVKYLSLITVLSPLLGSLIAGLAGRHVGKRGSHVVTIALMIVSFIAAVMTFKLVEFDGQSFVGTIYTWGISGSFQFNVGFMIDRLTAVMMTIVTFVALLVHIYSVAYMADDPSNQRFFSYVSLFTFMMLMLVTANNFFQLFFGWEGVGLVSYLLIGFWFNKESAAVGSLKAFIVNRIGDFGFILAIAAVLDYFGTLNYSTVFAKASTLTQTTISIFPGSHWSILTVICILLFIGAMGKSAQVPLHVWLPESMEGPTPISALIHAATMVTAGVFMVARFSPIFELSQVALSLVLVVGATGALFLGILAFVEYDIKRVVAYSTMSQLGYMMAANGASSFSAGIFHLLTHACFKALLFLSAGSVIIAMHHDQDLRNMGNLKKYLPITYVCFLIGALALSAIPPFSGFYSKDAIIEAVHLSTIPGATYAYWCLLIGSFVTGFYIFRAFFMAFHTKERMDEKLRSQLKETHWSMLLAMIALAIPSVGLGALLVEKILYQTPGLLGSGIHIASQYNVLAIMAKSFHGAWADAMHSVKTLPFWFAVSGVVSAWFVVIIAPQVREWMMKRFSWVYRFLVNQYGFDLFNDFVFTRGTRKIANFFFNVGDLKILDHYMVDGSGRNMTRISKMVRRLQSGYLYHYAFVMIIGLLGFMVWLIW
jgi:NADH-quinone oxidoreductase subunit L